MAAIKKEYPDLTVVGELFDGDPALVSFYQGGAPRFDGIDSGVDTLFDFPLYFTIRDAFAQGGSLREVAQMLARDHLYRDAVALVTFLGLHDVPRFMNEPGATIAGLKLGASPSCSPRAARRSSTTATRSRMPRRRRPRQPARLPGRLSRRRAQRLRGRGAHGRRAGRPRARAALLQLRQGARAAAPRAAAAPARDGPAVRVRADDSERCGRRGDQQRRDTGDRGRGPRRHRHRRGGRADGPARGCADAHRRSTRAPDARACAANGDDSRSTPPVIRVNVKRSR